MTQLWRTLLTFLFAHSQLARWMIHVFNCLQLFDQILADPDEADDNHSPEGRRLIESLIATAEDWITFLINARAAELAGLRYTYEEVARAHRWAPHVERSWPDLMQRYQRMRASFTTIERMARRQAARLKRVLSANPLNIIDPLAAIVRERVRPLEVLSRLAQDGSARLGAAKVAVRHARGPPSHLLVPPHPPIAPEVLRFRERTRLPDSDNPT